MTTEPENMNEQSADSENGMLTRKTYSTPELIHYGSMVEITQGTLSGVDLDVYQDFWDAPHTS